MGGDDGMDALREHLEQTFERVPPAKQKLTAQLDFVDSIVKKYQQQINEKTDSHRC